MPDWEQDALGAYVPIGVINSWSYESGSYGAWSAGGDTLVNLIPIANLAMYVPFVLNEEVTIYDMAWYNGPTVSGNVDVGLYAEDGTKLFSAGSTAQAGVSAVQSVALGSPLTIAHGNYYMALCIDNTTARFFGRSTTANIQEIMGIKQATAAFPLPSPAVFSAPAQLVYPFIAATITQGF